ncbi:hypothetical protein CRV08_03200 [Halarcobacter ebronensis]|uniref:Leucine-binding protein domain-containing protein n=1 Tax=Halarcobacter ebronensis TaxID=1462615 RepID=A0A4Q0YGE2_9BACT|nr:ABC transporter substrate-binding protein [Halarcobacter ebronensis]RXJ69726.1 hypothetical protein CRV08_03200 [Halarcobacter ebronensis]
MKKTIILLIIFFSCFLLFIFFIKKSDQIRIGFIGGLSGKYSDLGHSVLNGLRLAFEDSDYKIGNTKLRLLVKDDMQNESQAKKIINFFKEEKISLVVGNTTSSMVKVSLEETKNSDIVFISPSASSSTFSEIDDNFLRVQMAQSQKKFEILLKYLIKNNLTDIYAIYDLKNKDYSDSYIKNMQKSLFSNLGKSYLATSTFDESFEEILNKIKALKKVDALLIVAGSLDSSKLIQYLRINGIKQKIITSAWAQTTEFITEGGKNIEGTIFLSSYDENSKGERYLDFVNKYKKKFNTIPNIFSAQGYETGLIILEVLRKNKNIKEFKNELLKIKKFQGLQGYILFDEFGDVNKEPYLTQVKNGNFVKIE